MKRHLLLIAVSLLLLSPSAWSQTLLAGWDFSTQSGGTGKFGTSPLAATTAASNITVGGLTRASGFGSLTGSGAAGGWGSNNFTVSGTLTGEITANKFFTFTISASSGYKVSLNNIGAYNVRHSSSGPTTGQWQYQIGSGSFTNIGSALTWGSGNAQGQIDLSGISDLQNVVSGTTITIRLVTWGATSTGGTFYLNDPSKSTANDFTVNGSVSLAGTPGITTSPTSLTNFIQTSATPSATQTINVSGTTLSAGIVITPPAGFEISTDSATWKDSTQNITLTPDGNGAVAVTPLYVRLNRGTKGYSAPANITFTSTGATTQNVAVDGAYVTQYYPNATNLDDPINWGTNTDGSGTAPSDFTSDAQYFVINQSGTTIASNWTVSGNYSKIILGDGSSAITFTIADPFTVSGKIDLTANSTLSIASATAPLHTYGTVSSSSTVELAQTGTYTIPLTSSYQNLKLTGGVKVFDHGTTTIVGNLTFNNTTIDGAGTSTFSTINLAGNLTYTGTVIAPSDVDAITLNLNGTGTQTITSTPGDTIRFFTIKTNTSGQNVVIANAASRIFLRLGNASGGGFTLATGTTLALNDNTLEFFIDQAGTAGKAVLAGTGTISVTSNSNITLNSGNAATAAFGTLNLTTGQQTLNNLTVNLTGGNVNKAIQAVVLGSDVTVNGTLTLTKGYIYPGTHNLILGSSAAISGTPSNLNMIAPLGTGLVIKKLNDAAVLPYTFTFPIGDTLSAATYSPVDLSVETGTLSSAQVSAKLSNIKSTNNTSVTDYLNRYWSLAQSGITSGTYNGTFYYATGDVAGTEANLYAGLYNDSTWTEFSMVDNTNHKFTVTGTSVLGDFTAGEISAMPVELSSFSSTVNGRRVNLTWKTASEINTNGFSVLRTSDGQNNWKEIAFLKATGNSNVARSYGFTDQSVANGNYSYKLKIVDNDGTYKYSAESKAVVNTPNTFELAQNYPNPFNPSTMISYSLATDAKVTLKVYNALGSEVATVVNELQSAGPHAVSFSAGQYHLSSGIYFYKIQAGNFSETRRMMLLK